MHEVSLAATFLIGYVRHRPRSLHTRFVIGHVRYLLHSLHEKFATLYFRYLPNFGVIFLLSSVVQMSFRVYGLFFFPVFLAQNERFSLCFLPLFSSRASSCPGVSFVIAYPRRTPDSFNRKPTRQFSRTRKSPRASKNSNLWILAKFSSHSTRDRSGETKRAPNFCCAP